MSGEWNVEALEGGGKGPGTAKFDDADGQGKKEGSELEFIKTILNALPDAVFTTDMNGVITFFNRACEELTGWRAEDAIGRKAIEVFRGDGTKKETLIEKVLRTGKEVYNDDSDERAFIKPDGTVVPTMCSAIILRDPSGKPIGGLEVLKDITDIKERERAEKERREYLERSVLKILNGFNSLKEGNFDVRLEKEKDDEIGRIVDSFNELVEILRRIIYSVDEVVDAATEGDLSKRVVVDGAKGKFEDLVESINAMIEAFTRPMMASMEVLERVSEGDLTARVEMETKGDFKRFADRLNETIETMQNIIGNLKGTAENLVSMSESLASSSTEIKASMQQLNAASEEIASSSQKLAALAQEAQTNAEELNRIIDVTLRTFQEASSKSEEVVKDVQQVKESSEKAIEAVEKIRNEVGEASSAVKDIEEAIAHVEKMANLITDVAAQTNLLALNAAIEAARAGEHGRGFAVVADAVKELAEQVKRAAEEAIESVKNIQEMAKRAVSTSERASERTVSGGELIEDVIKNVLHIAELMGELDEKVKEAEEQAKRGNSYVENVMRSIDEVAAASEEGAAVSEETSSAVETQSTAAEELSASAHQLHSVAQELMNLVSRFRI